MDHTSTTTVCTFHSPSQTTPGKHYLVRIYNYPTGSDTNTWTYPSYRSGNSRFGSHTCKHIEKILEEGSGYTLGVAAVDVTAGMGRIPAIRLKSNSK